MQLHNTKKRYKQFLILWNFDTFKLSLKHKFIRSAWASDRRTFSSMANQSCRGSITRIAGLYKCWLMINLAISGVIVCGISHCQPICSLWKHCVVCLFFFPPCTQRLHIVCAGRANAQVRCIGGVCKPAYIHVIFSATYFTIHTIQSLTYYRFWCGCLVLSVESLHIQKKSRNFARFCVYAIVAKHTLYSIMFICI